MSEFQAKPKDGALATANAGQSNKIDRRTKKRSTAKLDGVQAAKNIKTEVSAPVTPEQIAISNATAWKAAAANAYLKEMDAAAQDVVKFMQDVNTQVANMLVASVQDAYAPIAEDLLVIEED